MRSIHYTYRTCGEKKNCPFSSLWPLYLTSSKAKFLDWGNFFFLSNKNAGSPKSRGKHRNVFTSCSEGHPTCGSLAKGLPYIRNRTGDQWSLEKYSHGRESRGEGWHKNLPALCIQILLEAHPLPGAPGTYGDFETCVEVQTISRARWVFFTGRDGAEGEGHTCQSGRQEMFGEWATLWCHRRGKF